MKGIQLIPHNTNIGFVKNKNITLTFSALIVIASIAIVMVRGLNFGIDFLGGFLIEVRTEQAADLGALREKLSLLDLGDMKLQNTDSERDVMIRVEQPKGGDEAQSAALQKIKEALGDNVEYRRVDSVGPTFSDDLKYNGFLSFTLAIAAMLFYIWLRFEWQFGLCAVFALLHDGIAIFGFYGLSQYDFNETVIIALLTTVGYSINDTVVVYDRIRENLRKYKKKSIPDLINLSINETLSRTILTSGTTLAALISLYVFGGTVIENFTLPIIVGISVGTYSSICLAAVLLLSFDLRAVVAESFAEQEDDTITT